VRNHTLPHVCGRACARHERTISGSTDNRNSISYTAYHQTHLSGSDSAPDLRGIGLRPNCRAACSTRTHAARPQSLPAAHVTPTPLRQHAAGACGPDSFILAHTCASLRHSPILCLTPLSRGLSAAGMQRARRPCRHDTQRSTAPERQARDWQRGK
jgi:hypothetical protein